MSHNSQNAENNKRMEISQQQVSIIAALCLTLAFFIFIAGVFWGKKSILERSPAELTGDIFTDRIYDACSKSSRLEPNRVNTEKLAGLFAEDDEVEGSRSTAKEEGASVSAKAPIEGAQAYDQGVKTAIQGAQADGSKTRYYAQLAAYNTEREAQDCVKKLAKRSIQVRISERLSKTQTGEMRAWYAVITEPWADKNQLIAWAQKIKRVRLVKDYKVIEEYTEQYKESKEQKNLPVSKKGANV